MLHPRRKAKAVIDLEDWYYILKYVHTTPVKAINPKMLQFYIPTHFFYVSKTLLSDPT